MKRKTKTIAAITNDAATLLQRLVRLKASDENGYCSCVTCGVSKHFSEMQGGHFIERGKSFSKLLEENIHPQCPHCNAFGMKNTSTVLAYRRYMIETYGDEFVNELEEMARENAPFKRNKLEIEGMIQDFKAQIKNQESRF
jgi:hypothetical protein